MKYDYVKRIQLCFITTGYIYKQQLKFQIKMQIWKCTLITIKILIIMEPK